MSFEVFVPLAPLGEQTLARWRPRVPEPIADLWVTHGTGLVGDGYVRMIDPDHALTMLDGALGLPERAVPLFTTALADLVFWMEPLFLVARFRFGLIDVIGYDADQLIASMADPVWLDQTLARDPYPQAAARLGVPGLDECFGFVPLLALGGTPDPAHLDRCGLWEHLSVICHLAGPPTMR